VILALASGDRDTFYEREIEARRSAGLPPFGRLASVIISAATRPEAEGHAKGLRRAAPQGSGISVLGPAEAPLALIRGRYRFRLLIHGSRRADMQGFIKAMLENGPKERGSVRVQVDIDPQSFL
jgi:primosomal protein N' (replication factor Y)